jgi:hypothetical protein
VKPAKRTVAEKPTLKLLSGSNITPASLDMLYKALTGRSMTPDELEYARKALAG